MIVGEKILCKRSLHQYEKGRYYYISYIDPKGYVFIPYNDDPADQFGYSTFHFKDNLKIKYDYQYFYDQIFLYDDYFRSLKEERKQKLNKIIENGNI